MNSQEQPMVASNRSRSHRFGLPACLAAAWCLRVGFVVMAVAWGSVGAERLWPPSAGPSAPSQVSHTPLLASADQLAPLTAILPGAGQWSFAGLEWDLSHALVPAHALNERFARLADTSDAGSAAAVALTDAGWHRLLEILPAQSVTTTGHQVHGFEHHDLRCQLVTHVVAGQPRVLSLAAAFPDERGRWQWFEVLPRLAADRESAERHLLPLPAAAARTGARQAADGRLQLELISLQSSAANLLARWRAAGWEVRRTSWGSAGEFSYLCGRGAEVIYAWSADAPHQLTNLMLVNSAIDLASHADERFSLAQEFKP